jgi:hypothetical protein
MRTTGGAVGEVCQAWWGGRSRLVAVGAGQSGCCAPLLYSNQPPVAVRLALPLTRRSRPLG